MLDALSEPLTTLSATPSTTVVSQLTSALSAASPGPRNISLRSSSGHASDHRILERLPAASPAQYSANNATQWPHQKLEDPLASPDQDVMVNLIFEPGSHASESTAVSAAAIGIDRRPRLDRPQGTVSRHFQ